MEKYKVNWRACGVPLCLCFTQVNQTVLKNGLSPPTTHHPPTFHPHLPTELLNSHYTFFPPLIPGGSFSFQQRHSFRIQRFCCLCAHWTQVLPCLNSDQSTYVEIAVLQIKMSAPALCWELSLLHVGDVEWKASPCPESCFHNLTN